MDISYDFINQKIDNRIKSVFPLISYSIYEDTETKDIIIAFHSDEIYYSDKCMELITDINKSILWPENIYNFIFIYEEATIYKTEYKFSISNTNLNYNYVLNSSGYQHTELVYIYSDDEKMVA